MTVSSGLAVQLRRVPVRPRRSLHPDLLEVRRQIAVFRIGGRVRVPEVRVRQRRVPLRRAGHVRAARVALQRPAGLSALRGREALRVHAGPVPVLAGRRLCGLS